MCVNVCLFAFCFCFVHCIHFAMLFTLCALLVTCHHCRAVRCLFSSFFCVFKLCFPLCKAQNRTLQTFCKTTEKWLVSSSFPSICYGWVVVCRACRTLMCVCVCVHTNNMHFPNQIENNWKAQGKLINSCLRKNHCSERKKEKKKRAILWQRATKTLSSGPIDILL